MLSSHSRLRHRRTFPTIRLCLNRRPKGLSHLLISTFAIGSHAHFDPTALMHACFQGHASTVEYLLQLPSSLPVAPPNVNARDSAGRTPLIHACVRGHADIVAMLLRYRPSSNSSLSSSSSSSAPHKRGAKSAAPKMPLLPVDTGVVDAKGWTALMVACWMGHAACVRALLGDDHTASDAAASASAHAAASGSSPRAGTDSVSAASSRSATDARSASGSSTRSAISSTALNARCAELHDRTALMMASENGHAACVDLLLAAGACYM